MLARKTNNNDSNRKQNKPSNMATKSKQNPPGKKKAYPQNKVKKPSIPARLSDFSRALIDPFNPAVLGCQVPDPYPFPTTSYHSHSTTVFGTTTGNTTGSFVYLPNPVFSMVDLAGVLNPTVVAARCVTSTPLNQFYTVSNQASSNYYGASTPVDLATKFSEMRVVSWGIKISNLQPELSATGKIFIAQIPMGDTIPSYNGLVATNLNSGIAGIFGVPVAALSSAAILNLPSCIELTVGDLLRGDVQVGGLYTNPNFWTFKSVVSASVPATNYVAGDDFEVLNTGLVSSAGYKDLTRCVGGSSIVVYFEGFPAGLANALQVEVIYHLEGQPQISSSVASTFVPSSKHSPLLGSSARVEEAMSVSASKGLISFITKGTKFLNDNQGLILSAAGSAIRLASLI